VSRRRRRSRRTRIGRRRYSCIYLSEVFMYKFIERERARKPESESGNKDVTYIHMLKFGVRFHEHH
jgi:hypothetical protein